MVNQQKGVQQQTAYSAVVVNDHNPVTTFTCFYDLTNGYSKGVVNAYDTYYDHSLQLHYRQFLVALVFHPPSFHDYIYLFH